MANTEVGAAYVSVYPDTSGFSSAISRQLNGSSMTSIGMSLGKSLTSGMSSSLSGIGSMLEGLGGKISSGFTALTAPAIGAVTGLGSAILGVTAMKGWTRALNIEGANRLFRGLGLSVEDIDSAMKSANEAVLGTAFGLDEAAQAAALLSTSGVELGKDMDTNLRAIAGVATMAGASMSDITQIFQTVAAKGKVSGLELTRLAQRGINATDALAKHLGVSQSKVKEMVSEGVVDFKTFSDAMYEAFGEAAYGANETFAGALMNVQAALGRIGEKFATPLQQSLRDVFANAIPAINAVNTALTPIVNRFSELAQTISGKLVEGLTAFEEHRFVGLDEDGKKVYSDTIPMLESLKVAMEAVFSPEQIERIKQAATAIGLFAASGPALTLMGKGVKAFSPLMTMLDKAGASYVKFMGGAGGGIVSSLATAGKNGGLSFAQNLLATLPSGLNNIKLPSIFGKAANVLSGMGSFAKEVSSGFVGLLGGAFKNVTGPVGTIIGNAFGSAKSGLSSALSGFGGVLKNGLGKAANVGAKGLIGLTGAVAGLSVGVMTLGLAMVKGGIDITAATANITSTMSAMTENMGTAITQLSAQLPEAVAQIAALMPELMDAISSALKELVPVVLEIIPVLADAISVVISSLLPVIIGLLPLIFEAGVELFMGLLQALTDVAPVIIAMLPVLIADFGKVIADNLPKILSTSIKLFTGIVTALIKVAPEVIGQLIALIPKLLWELIRAIPEMLSAAAELFSAIGEAIPNVAGEVIGKVGELVSKLPEKVGEFVGEMFNAGANLVNGLIRGIGSLASSLWGKITGMVSGAVSAARNELDEHSPSKVFFQIGAYAVEGMIEGISNEARNLYGTVSSVMSDFSEQASMEASIGYSAVFDSADTPEPAYADTFIFNITADSETTLQRLVQEAQRARMQYA